MINTVEGKITLSTGIEVYHRCWLADNQKGVVVGVHGFAEHSGRYANLGGFLASNGFSLCMHDLRGHGLTASPNNVGFVENFNLYIDDVRAFIEYVMDRLHVSDVVILGHSMGGLITLLYLGKIKKYIRAAVTSGAAAIIRISTGNRIALTLMSALSPKTRVNLPIVPDFLTHDKNVVKAYVDDPLVFKRPTVKLIYEMYKASKDVWRYVGNIDTPILIMHGAEDKIVPLKASQDVYTMIKSGDKTLRIYEGMYHEIFNEVNREVVYKDLIEWLSRH